MNVNLYLFEWELERNRIKESMCTDSCKVKRLAEVTEAQKWELTNPFYCRACRGAGILSYSENQAPFGSGQVWLEDSSEPCNYCTGEELIKVKCPKCAYLIFVHFLDIEYLLDVPKELDDGLAERISLVDAWENVECAVEKWVSESQECPHCGWNWGAGDDDILPFLDEMGYCGCENDEGDNIADVFDDLLPQDAFFDEFGGLV